MKDKVTKRNWILHPFFFGVYPVLSLLAFNLNQAAPAEAIRSLVVMVLVTAVLLLLFKLILRDWGRAALLTTLYFILFFAYSPIIASSQSFFRSKLGISSIDLHRYMTSLFMCLLILFTWGLWRVVKRDVGGMTRFLNIVTAVALSLPLYQIIHHTLINLSLRPEPTTRPPITATTTDTPDIYYIILDEYTSNDVLQELFDHDNAEFTNFLRDQGFYVTDNGRSNYTQTSLSLSSSMNLTYVNDIAERLGSESEDRTPLKAMIQNNEAMSFLRQHGYQIVTVASGWATTEFREADVFLTAEGAMINEFETILVENTWPGTLFPTTFSYELKRQHFLHIFDSIEQIVAHASPKFVFLHIYSPHFPLVFGPNGEKTRPTIRYDQFTQLPAGEVRDTYIREYRDEVTYLNKRLMAAVTTILAQSERPPIIIIQGDHGSRAMFDISSIENSCIRERLSIFNAYYFPGKDAETLLYETITPVNTFRLILESYFDVDLPLLPDESYFSTSRRPYELINVTNTFETTCHAPD